MLPNPQFSVNLASFTDEIVTGKLHFLCSVSLIFSLEETISICTSALYNECCIFNISKFKPFSAGKIEKFNV